VRSTFEDCKYVKTVLYNFRVLVEERDVYVNKFFYKELEDRLECSGIDILPLPQLFISGQHIGVNVFIELCYTTHFVELNYSCSAAISSEG